MAKKFTIKEKIERKEKPNGTDSTHPVWKMQKPEKVIPRSFRWNLRTEKSPDIHWWFKKLKTNYKNKTIEIHVYDDREGSVYNWIQSIIDNSHPENLILEHLNGSNRTMYTITFSDLEMVDHNTQYDYESNEVLTHRMVISFGKMKRTNNLDIN